LERELLAELDHAGLADSQRIGELLRGIVAQQLGVLEDEVGDPALDRRHLVALRADLDQRRHGRQAALYSASGTRPSSWRMPSPGAAATAMSGSPKITPPGTRPAAPGPRSRGCRAGGRR